MTVVEWGHTRAGQTIVIQGASGVTLFAVEFALAHWRVIVPSSSADKLVRLKPLGPIEGIDHSAIPEWQHKVMELTNGRGADHILEMAGGENLGRSLEAMSLGGRISMIGLLGDSQPGGPIGSLLSKRATIAGIGVGPRRAL
jgi:NADPH:quinone reductase-like Zn-dependent oxidoreductase